MFADVTAARSFQRGALTLVTWGNFWLLIASIGAALFFVDGLDALLAAWQLPEYSHGPLIPVLSALMFLRELKAYPPEPGPKRDRWVGVLVLFLALVLGMLGKLANISDIVAYATIIWVAGILLISFGWSTGKHFWPPVLHLVYMLPLPGVLYFKLSTWLQFVSSELGVFFLQLAGVTVFLEGNIIDLGVLKLHVAEACSGLRYLFPILSFSYIFAVLYRGPVWHKIVLLVSAAPITVLMNSVRIAIAGILTQYFGEEWLEGFTHFFEGWVIFLLCVLMLFFLAWLLLFLHPRRMTLTKALDLETEGLGTQAMRLKYTRASKALIAGAAMTFLAIGVWQLVPERGGAQIERDSFALFPRSIDEWEQVDREILTPRIINALQADDYHSVTFAKPEEEFPVSFFSAWYADQSQGGVHSPEICLPSSGWEIAWLERTDVTEALNSDRPFNINRAVIQKGETRMMVYYWFEQKGRKVAWDFAAKFHLMVDGIATGRTDGALVRMTTLIGPEESNAEAEARLQDLLVDIVPSLPRFIPES